ncbi:MAG: zinc ribbon domain-containing protein [Actinomycetota bacterium]
MAVTRYCPRCGHARTEGERFCRKCGAALGSGETKLTPTPVVTSGAGEATASLPPVAPPSSALPPPPGAPPIAVPPIATAPPTPAPQAVQTPRRSVAVKPLPVVGGLVLLVSTFLPWISAAGSANALDIPIQALWDIEAADGPVKLGFALLALGVLGAGLALIQRSPWFRRLCGSIGVAIVLGFAAQLYRAIDASGGSVGDVFTTIGAGVYVALAGAVALQFSR